MRGTLIRNFEADLVQSILLAVKRNVEAVPMVAAFLTGIVNTASEGKIPESSIHIVFSQIVKDFAERFTLTTMDLSDDIVSNKRLRTVYGIARQSQNTSIQNQESSTTTTARKTAQNIANLLHQCIVLDLETELSQLLAKLISNTRILHVDAFYTSTTAETLGRKIKISFAIS